LANFIFPWKHSCSRNSCSFSGICQRQTRPVLLGVEQLVLRNQHKETLINLVTNFMEQMESWEAYNYRISSPFTEPEGSLP
jgi:hypothetical protein